MALLLQKMRNLQSLVFVETGQGTRRRFVGLAEPSTVRWALARHSRQLEVAFSKAYYKTMSGHDVAITSLKGRVASAWDPNEVWPALELLRFFLEGVQWPPPDIPEREEEEEVEEEEEWVPLKKREASEPQRFERAQWLTARLLEDILGGGLVTASVRSVDFYGKPSMEQVRITLSQKEGRYFALTREDGRFESLIDREPLLEEVARSAVQESTIR